MSIRLLLALVMFSGATAAQDRGPAPRQLDCYGYPLPPGAIARIGAPPALTGFASSLAWSSDGKQFLAADWDGVTIFDAASGRRITSLPGATDAKNVSAPLTRDGRTLLRLNGSAGSLIDLESGDSLLSFTLPPPLGDVGRRLYSLNVSANHRFLCGISSESSMPGVAWRYDLARKRFNRLINDRADLQSMRLSPDGKHVYATGGTSEPELTARLTGSDKELWTVRLKGTGTLRAISADGSRLVIADVGALWVFDSADGKRVMTTPVESQSPPGVWGIDISPDGKLLALADGEHVLVREVSTANLLYRFDQPARLVAFSPDSKSLLTASTWVQRWDLSTGKPMFPQSLLDRPDGAELLAWSRDGQKLLSSVWPGTRVAGGGQRKPGLLALWYVPNAQCEWHLRHDERVLAASISSDGSTVRSYVEGTLLRTWNVRDASKVTVSQMYLQPIATQHTAVAFLPDDRFTVLSQSAQGSALDVYDAFGKPDHRRTRGLPEMPSEQRRVLQHRGQSTTTFGPGGWRFDLMANRDMPPLQQSLTFRVINLINTQSSAVVAGRTIDQTTVQGYVWESLTGRVIGDLPADLPITDRAMISGDSRFLAMPTDKFVMVRDFKEPTKSIRLAITGTTAIAFSPDASRIATAHDDGTILIWNVAREPRPWLEESERMWKDLESDAPTAWKSIWHLLDHPGPAAEFLKARLHPEPGLTDTGEQIARLDHPKYSVREQAARELAGRGEIIEGDLQAALKAPRSEEQRARVQQLLNKLNPAVPPSGQMLRGLRCVWLLERLATPEATAILKNLSNGASGSRITTESKAALARLAASR